MINRNFYSGSGSGQGSGPVIDMTSDGAFVSTPRTQPSLGRIVSRLVGFGVLLGIAAVTFWAALFIIPTLILLGLAGYAVTRLLGGAPSRNLRRF